MSLLSDGFCGRVTAETAGNQKGIKLPPTTQLILGEFATRIDDGAKHSPWGISGSDTVLARLQVAATKGYDWAFPWSATDGIERSPFNAYTQTQYPQFGQS